VTEVHRTLTAEGSGTDLETQWRRVAAASARCAPAEVSFDAGAWDPAAVAKARAMWRARMVSEHRSTAVFAGIAGQLMEAGAPMDFKAMALSMAQDELRHTELCADVVRALGGDARCEADLTVGSLPTHGRVTPEERALRNVVYGSCLSEMVNSARFVDALESITEPVTRDATRRLLADEVEHARFGFTYLDVMGRWLDEHAGVRASLGQYLRRAFKTFERAYAGNGARARLTDDERALGLPDPERLLAVFDQTVRGAIIPGLEQRGIAATEAWNARGE
jgi:hypothetical protein